jgi:HAD superfamily hydrolase (TIGR01549 family)
MDGTLLDTESVWYEPTKAAFAACGLSITEEEIHSLAGISLTDFLEERGERNQYDRIRAERDVLVIDMIHTHARWVEGAVECIEAVQQSMHGIVTSAPVRIVGALDSALHMSAYMKIIVNGEQVAPLYKPHPKGLRIACENLQVQPADCVYIGDQLNDLKAAEAAGMDAILFRGSMTPKDLTHEKMVQDFAELKMLLH